jgi:hypothetical protein
MSQREPNEEVEIAETFLFDFPAFDYSWAHLPCDFCLKATLSPKYRCQADNCYRAFHPECLRKTGTKLMDPTQVLAPPDRNQDSIQFMDPLPIQRVSQDSVHLALMRLDQLPILYCKRHQVLLKAEEERADRRERAMEVAEFARNLEYCQLKIKRNQDSRVKGEIGTAAFNFIFGG